MRTLGPWGQARVDAKKDLTTFYDCEVQENDDGTTLFICRGETVARIEPYRHHSDRSVCLRAWVSGHHKSPGYFRTKKGALRGVKVRMFESREDGCDDFDNVPVPFTDSKPKDPPMIPFNVLDTARNLIGDLESPVVPRRGDVLALPDGQEFEVGTVCHRFRAGPTEIGPAYLEVTVTPL